MTKKEQCKKIMNDLFGPATAATVDSMTEDNCVEKCKQKVEVFLGKEKAKLFDGI